MSMESAIVGVAAGGGWSRAAVGEDGRKLLQHYEARFQYNRALGSLNLRRNSPRAHWNQMNPSPQYLQH
jgi:hypothetical protein